MAVNNSRSMNADLKAGALDGKFKSLTPGRGGEVEEAYVTKRQMVLQEQYGMTPRSPIAEVREVAIEQGLGTK
jgi:hypothetical protein